MIATIVGLVSAVVILVLGVRISRLNDDLDDALDQVDDITEQLSKAQVDPITGSTFTPRHAKAAFVPDPEKHAQAVTWLDELSDDTQEWLAEDTDDDPAAA